MFKHIPLVYIALCFAEGFHEIKRNDWDSRTTWLGGVLIFAALGDTIFPGWSGMQPNTATWQSALIFWTAVVFLAIGGFGHMVIEDRRKAKPAQDC